MKKYFTKEYVLANKKQLMRYGIIAVIICVAVFVFFFKTGDEDTISTENEQIIASAKTENDKKEQKTIIVDVSGQVKVPQVLELDEGSRISDAIDAAGGLTDKADISQINRASELNDGEKIYIPAKGEAENNGVSEGNISGGSEQSNIGGATTNSGSSAANNGTTGNTSTKVNINSASNSQLQTLNGVGPATAEKILMYRSQNGSFKTIEDLKNVNGIGDKTFEKLKPYITI